MIAEQLIDDIDYDESGDGPTVVFVPGSCSTGAAWRPVISALNGHFHCVTTSLLGYGFGCGFFILDFAQAILNGSKTLLLSEFFC